MEIQVKNCFGCPFLDVNSERDDKYGGMLYFYDCKKGAFGVSQQKPDRNSVPTNCPLIKEDIIITLKKD